MIVQLTVEQKSRLKARIGRGEDCEELPGDEYAVDIYERDVPMALELQWVKEGVEVLAAAQLSYDEALDGWYISGRVEDAQEVREALLEWMDS